jgi:hypothetical protein
MSPEPERDRGAGATSKSGLAAVGVVAFAVLCCAGGPLLAAVAGGLAFGAVLGIGAGVAALIGLVAVVVLRARRRRACAVTGARADPGASR